MLHLIHADSHVTHARQPTDLHDPYRRDEAHSNHGAMHLFPDSHHSLVLATRPLVVERRLDREHVLAILSAEPGECHPGLRLPVRPARRRVGLVIPLERRRQTGPALGQRPLQSGQVK